MSNHWSEPGAYPVADGVHRIPLPLPMDALRAVNVYVLETERGLTCIDGGWAIEAGRRQFEQSLASVGHHPRDITSFLVTHVHRDHYTQAVTLRTEFGRATVSLGLGDKAALDLVERGLDQDPVVRRVERGGAPEIARVWDEASRANPADPSLWLKPDHWLEGDGTVLVGSRQLAAVATPGHTDGHFVFADLEARLLFAGDHVLPTITPSIGFQAPETGYPLQDYLASLAKVRALPDLRLLPAHGEPGMGSHERIDQLLAHHDHRLELCAAAVAAGARTAYEVAVELPWTRRQRSFGQLDVYNQGLAVLETMVHLDLLMVREQLARELVEGVAFYRPPD